MKVLIDDREGKRAKRAYKYFHNKGYNPIIAELRYGDYCFHKNNIAVAFEYKTMEDYLSSISNHRVFNQALNQSNHFDYHFVLVVGDWNKYDRAVKKKGYHSGNYIGKKSWNGSIASLVNFTSFLQSPSEEWSFDLMLRVALKCVKDKPVVHRFPKSRGSPAYRFLCNNVNRVGEKKAKLICDTLGLVSLGDVFCLTVDDLVRVNGVGRKGAELIVGEIWGGYLG